MVGAREGRAGCWVGSSVDEGKGMGRDGKKGVGMVRQRVYHMGQ